MLLFLFSFLFFSVVVLVINLFQLVAKVFLPFSFPDKSFLVIMQHNEEQMKHIKFVIDALSLYDFMVPFMCTQLSN